MDQKNKKAIKIYDIIAEDYARRFECIESADDLKKAIESLFCFNYKNLNLTKNQFHV